MVDGVLIANRGVAASRVLRTLRRMGLRSVAVHSEADRHAPHTLAADRSICIGPPRVESSYLNGAAVLDAARIAGVAAIHPGYGMLSDNAGFARSVEAAGMAFLGPTPETLRTIGAGTAALAAELGLSIEAGRSITHARHLEVQIFGDGSGAAVSLGERDCSAKRGAVTIFAEAPAPSLAAGVRAALTEAAVGLARRLRYRGAGVIEFVYDADHGAFFFRGVQPNLGVDHALAEACSGVDIVEWMVQLGLGAPPETAPLASVPKRHATSVRVYADDALPAGKHAESLITEVKVPPEVRVDAWIERGARKTPTDEPLLAQVLASGPDRGAALAALATALDGTCIGGIPTNLPYLRQVVRDPLVVAGELTTATLTRIDPESATIEVLAPGPFTIVVDHPGRIGFWNVGVPPSGPMDALAFRLANRIVGNPETSAGLELTLSGPKLRFASEAIVALTGARFTATLDGEPLGHYRPIRIRAGQTLAIGGTDGAGCRAYLAVRGGLDVPPYLGSRTTFTLGGFGGHGGRTLRQSDVLHIGRDEPTSSPTPLPQELIPAYENRWHIGVLYGPHGAPDFFTPKDIATFFSTDWEVHYNSNRTGVRLIGPKPQWARPDGGEAGLHPSNIHDTAYAVGAVDYTGDMPIVLGPDGPSLGGFVCPATVVHAELWKLGQLKAGDRVRFVPLTPEDAAELQRAQTQGIASLRAEPARRPVTIPPDGAVLGELPETPSRVRVVYRRAGDRYLLVEYGPLVLDLRLRFRVHALMQWLLDAKLCGIVDLTPGIRSLQVHYDNHLLSTEKLLEALRSAESELTFSSDAAVPSRVVHLPLSWDDPATRLAIAKYAQSVRPDAPWCPSNIEFIRRINGLASVDDVRRIVFEASYLVLGLGDVYLGAPVATPIDPRQRLVTTKYNPARTWTPENAVGIGGAYLCIYGMEGPGGYQFVGRTLQVYNRFRQTRDFCEDKPWLLRFFDQIRFYPVSAEELLDMREAFPHGKVELRTEQTVFRLSEYERLLSDNRDSITHFKSRQQAAFDAERGRWIEAGQLTTGDSTKSVAVPKHHDGVASRPGAPPPSSS